MFSTFFRPASPSETTSSSCPVNDPANLVELATDILSLTADHKYDQALKLAQSSIFSGMVPSLEKIKSTAQSDLERSVALSIDINEASISGAEMNRASIEINTRAQGMAAAVEEMSSTSASILHTVQNVNGRTEEMQHNVAVGRQASNELMSANVQIKSAVTETEDRVVDLVASTNAIDKILTIISSISEKTKLLALNATIEAARAGEAGKGFAVVAGEVKTLANQTAESAEEISQKVKTLVSVTQSISSMMQRVATAVNDGQTKLEATNVSMNEIGRNSSDISAQMAEVSTILQEQNAASQEIAHGTSIIAEMTKDSIGHINHTLDAMDMAEKKLVDKITAFVPAELQSLTINLAKSDHVIWKKRLASMVAGRITLNPDELANHQTCRLGKWYYSDKADAYRSNPAFRNIEAYHIDVHKHGIEAARKYKNNDLAGALQEIEQVGKASVHVLEHLDKLRG
jgi:methyl-accepting chemotaxis protein